VDTPIENQLAESNMDQNSTSVKSQRGNSEWGNIDGPKQTMSPMSTVSTDNFFDDEDADTNKGNNIVIYDVRMPTRKGGISSHVRKSMRQRRIVVGIKNRYGTAPSSLEGARRASSETNAKKSFSPGLSLGRATSLSHLANTERSSTLRGNVNRIASLGDVDGDHDLDRKDSFDGSTIVSPAELEEYVQDGDELYIKVFKPITLKEARNSLQAACESDSEDMYSSDDNSIETVSVVSKSTLQSTRQSSRSRTICGWRKYYSMPVDQLNITKTEKWKCQITTRSTRFKKWIIFATEEERLAFQNLVYSLQVKIKNWHQEHLMSELKASNSSPSTPVNLLVEIVSATGLRNADIGGLSDPFVKVRLGNRVLHTTKRIDNTLNPIWTTETNSLFLITDAMDEFFHSGYAVTFEVIDYDVLGKNAILGFARVPQGVLLKATGSRLEFPLEEIKNRRKSAGTLMVRCRQATQKDMQFMAKINSEKKMATKHGVANQSEFIKPVRPPSVTAKTMKKHSEEGSELIRVRPYPNPEQESETKWMTPDEIERMSYEESHKWIEAGSGSRGVLYVEIIGCDGLPNMDAGVNKRDKTDAFVTAIFEDAIVSTDVIFDCLSPRFMPWTRRAFSFLISHPWSPLLLGVHDYDTGSHNDAIGRVQVDLGNFAPNTEYILHYDLSNTAIVPNRKKIGTITIRLCLEYHDTTLQLHRERLSFPNRFRVNVQDKKDFRVAKFVADGGKDISKYSIETITMHVEELATCLNIVFYMYNALMFIYEWRGHIPLRFCWPYGKCGEVELLVPLHSIIAFVGAVLLVERPTLAPAMFTASLGWIMLAMLELKTSRPSPWARPPTYIETVKTLVTGEFTPQTITAQESCLADEIRVGADKKKRDEQVKYLTDMYNDKMKEWEVMTEFMGENLDLENIDTNTSKGFSTLPGRSILYPWQVWFAQLCQVRRTIESILTWNSYTPAFCITSASLGLGVLFLFIPWGFLTLWSARFVAWIVLGPWRKMMKNEMTLWEQRRITKEAKKKKNEAFEKEMEALQIQKEGALKMAALKKNIFGCFIVSCPCPMVKVDRYHDAPLPKSSAKPIAEENSKSSRINKKEKTRLQGQE